MSTILKNCAGLGSIAWLIGVYALMERAPDNCALRKLDFSSYLVLFAFLEVWWGVGLVSALTGLRCRALAGRVCAVIAICIFAYFALDFLFPSVAVGSRAERPTSRELTPDGRLSQSR